MRVESGAPLVQGMWLAVSLTISLSMSHAFGQERPNPVIQAWAPSIQPLSRSVDLNVGESTDVVLSNGSPVKLRLLDLRETRDEVCFAVRRAEVLVKINGRTLELVSANYNLPKTIGSVQIDCPITTGNNSNGDAKFWGLDKDVRLRLWPAASPLINPGTFLYPAKQKWFANKTTSSSLLLSGGMVSSTVLIR